MTIYKMIGNYGGQLELTWFRGLSDNKDEGSQVDVSYIMGHLKVKARWREVRRKGTLFLPNLKFL